MLKRMMLAAAVVVVAMLHASPVRAQEKKPRLFEIRTYITYDGKLDALNARFRDHTNKLFIKHGMEIVGYWVPTDPEKSKNTLVYILAFADKEARDKAFKSFQADPDWQKARTESEKDGKIVKQVISELMIATDYSPMK